MTANLATGTRITVRHEDFLVTDVRTKHDGTQIIEAEGISELVKGKRFAFDTLVGKDIQVLDPDHTQLLPDTTPATNVSNSLSKRKSVMLVGWEKRVK